jgi:hypothetical protein
MSFLSAALRGFNLGSFASLASFGATDALGSLFGGGGGRGGAGSLGDMFQGMGSGGAGFTRIEGPAQASIADGKGLKAQYDALDMTRANTGQGFNAAELGNLNLGINRVNQNTAARNNAITQNMAARGLGGSGLQTALKASAEQAGANSASEAGTMAQDQANARALDSIENLGTLGGQINEQAFNRGAAQDALNMFNSTGQTQATQFNQSRFDYNRNAERQRKLDQRGQNMQLIGSALGAGSTAYAGGKK